MPRHTTCQNLGILSGSFQIEYLGTVISDSRMRVRDHLPLVERMTDRMSGWQADHLSQAGRVVLIKSVLQAIPVHSFSSGWIAKSTIGKMERISSSEEKLYFGSESGLVE